MHINTFQVFKSHRRLVAPFWVAQTGNHSITSSEKVLLNRVGAGPSELDGT